MKKKLFLCFEFYNLFEVKLHARALYTNLPNFPEIKFHDEVWMMRLYKMAEGSKLMPVKGNIRQKVQG